MDFLRALTFPVSVKGWLRPALTAVLVQFIPMVGTAAVAGWLYKIFLQTHSDPHADHGLPRWDNLIEILGNGLTLIISFLVFLLPLVLFFIADLFAAFLSTLATGLLGEEVSTFMRGLVTGQYEAIFVAIGALFTIAYMIPMFIVYWAALMRFENSGSFLAFMEFTENLQLAWDYREQFILAFLFVVIGGVMTVVIFTISVVGLFLIFPFFGGFMAHIVGQLAAQIDAAGDTDPVQPMVAATTRRSG
ncbi:MAG: DUF4013 domain-containing protein [Chloroflexi bacterium]|nr:DUF4013 domain-containing protein [Chloroflexota bacterium]